MTAVFTELITSVEAHTEILGFGDITHSGNIGRVFHYDFRSQRGFMEERVFVLKIDRRMNRSLPGRQAKRGHPRQSDWYMQRHGSMSEHGTLGTVAGVPGYRPRRAPLCPGRRLLFSRAVGLSQLWEAIG